MKFNRQIRSGSGPRRGRGLWCFLLVTGAAVALMGASPHAAAPQCLPTIQCVGGSHGHHGSDHSHDDGSSDRHTASQGAAGGAGQAAPQPRAASKRGKKSKSKPWPTDTLSFKTGEGTWIDVSLSPDGKRIVFDILGDLYIIGHKGGSATHLTKGSAYDSQPRWSPDGKQILFTSDRGGGSNIWTIQPDGKGLRQMTFNKWMETNSPIWSRSGHYFVTRRRFTDRRSVGTVELWMHHVIGGKGFRLTSRKKIADANDPAFSHDDRYIYFAARGRHRYNRNVHGGIWNVMRLDLQSRKRLLISRNASRPTPSPDGKWLALLRRIGRKSAIVLHELATGSERLLLDHLDHDEQEGFATAGTYPGFEWTPDSKAIVYTAQGRLWRMALKGRKRTAIPFVAQIKQKIRKALLFHRRIGQPQFQVKMLRWSRLSPNGDRLITQALGQLYTLPWPPKGQTPTRLTNDKHLEFAPAFSSDGSKIAYVSWQDGVGGHVWIRPIGRDGKPGPAKRITAAAAHYANPAFSTDGKQLTFVQASGTQARGLSSSWQPWQRIVRVDLSDKLPTAKLHHVATLRNRGSLSHIQQPHFTADGARIYFTRITYKGYKRFTVLCSRRSDGTDERKYASIYAADDLKVSPDGRWLLFRHLHHIYLAPLPPGQPRAMALRLNNGSYGGSPMPILHLSAGDDGGLWSDWSGTKKPTITWSLGASIYTISLANAVATLRRKHAKKKKKKQKARKKSKKKGAKGKKAKKKKKKKKQKRLKDVKRWELAFKAPAAQPKGWLALTDLRIITMKGNEIIAKGTILIKGSRIHKVGPTGQIKLPKGTRVISLKGQTAIPGMIDVHAHMHYDALDIHPQKNWSYRVNLAYGVTTIHDPSASTELVFAQAERVRAGLLVGPRVFSTGFILYGAENIHKAHIRKLRDAIHHVRRLKRLGAWSVKSYMQPTRKQRRWVMEAARRLKMLVYPEGGGKLDMNLSMILDGHTGIEHALPVAPLYQDVIRLFATSQTGYTPTLLVAYGGVSGETFFHQNSPAWDDPKLKRFYPQRQLNAIARRRSHVILDGDWHHKTIAKYAYRIVKAGGRVQIGSHGQLQGLGYHWELAALQQGGMPPHDVLRAATLHGAVYLGLDKDLGSIEPGKLADIAILKRDPLQQIQHTNSLSIVIKGGTAYRADDLTPYPLPKATK